MIWIGLCSFVGGGERIASTSLPAEIRVLRRVRTRGLKYSRLQVVFPPEIPFRKCTPHASATTTSLAAAATSFPAVSLTSFSHAVLSARSSNRRPIRRTISQTPPRPPLPPRPPRLPLSSSSSSSLSSSSSSSLSFSFSSPSSSSPSSWSSSPCSSSSSSPFSISWLISSLFWSFLPPRQSRLWKSDYSDPISQPAG